MLWTVRQVPQAHRTACRPHAWMELRRRRDASCAACHVFHARRLPCPIHACREPRSRRDARSRALVQLAHCMRARQRPLWRSAVADRKSRARAASSTPPRSGRSRHRTRARQVRWRWTHRTVRVSSSASSMWAPHCQTAEHSRRRCAERATTAPAQDSARCHCCCCATATSHALVAMRSSRSVTHAATRRTVRRSATRAVVSHLTSPRRNERARQARRHAPSISQIDG